MFNKNTTTIYNWNNKQVDFKPKSSYFDAIDFIKKDNGTLKFEFYNSPSNKESWNLLENDCVVFAEAICKLECEVVYSGRGQLSQISVAPKNIF